MQEIIVLLLASAALLYLAYKFIIKSKSKSCDKCELSDQKSTKKY